MYIYYDSLVQYIPALRTGGLTNQRPAMKDSLVELPLENWSQLKESFKKRWPDSLYACCLLETHEKWCKNGCKIIQVYVPYGKLDNGMVALVKFTDLFYSLMIHSANENLEPLIEALVTTQKIDWSRPTGVIIQCLDERLDKSIEVVIERLQMQSLWKSPTIAVYKKKGEKPTLTTECPDDLYVSTLTSDHAEQVNDTWPHKFEGSVQFFITMIEQNGGYGLFTKSDDCLISWISLNEFGALGHLYCVEEHRRKGHAQLMTRIMEKKLREDGVEVHTFILEDNTLSIGMFKKMGYEDYANVSWMHVIKTEHGATPETLKHCMSH